MLSQSRHNVRVQNRELDAFEELPDAVIEKIAKILDADIDNEYVTLLDLAQTAASVAMAGPGHLTLAPLAAELWRLLRARLPDPSKS